MPPLTAAATRLHKKLPGAIVEHMGKGSRSPPPEAKENCTNHVHIDQPHEGSYCGCGSTQKENNRKHAPKDELRYSADQLPANSKRPRTPLSTVSDESDGSVTPSPRHNVSPNQRPCASPSLRRLTPSPSGNSSPTLHNRPGNGSMGRFTPIQENFRRMEVEDSVKSSTCSRVQILPLRTPPRTTVSLDNVDLWEESDNEGDGMETVSEFDKINGVIINPRKTFDFSELRRARSTLESSKHQPYAVPIIDTVPVNNNGNITPDKCNRKYEPKAKTGNKNRINQTKTEEAPKVNKPKIRLTPKMRSLFDQRKPEVHKIKHESPLSEKRETKYGRGIINNSPCEKLPKVAMNNTTESYSPQIMGSSSAFDAYVPQGLHLSLPRESGAFSSPKSTRDDTTDRQEALKSKDISSEKQSSSSRYHSKSSSKPNGKHKEPPQAEERRVTFNEQVTIKDGEMSTLELLRSSHNSAQLFKQKYLGKSVSTGTPCYSGNVYTSAWDSEEFGF